MNRNAELLEDLTGDLARALKKSWSDTQNDKTSFENSPISTPQCNHYHNISPDEGSLASASSQVTSFTDDSNNAIGRSNIVGCGFPDYRPIERHYSLTEQPNVNTTNRGSDVLVESLEGENIQSLMAAPVALPLRRGSIQEVQRARQLSNPRSSFSGAPLEEPSFQEDCRITWVTILAGTSSEYVKPVLVLQESLKDVQSKFELCVIHNSDIDASEISKMGIKTVAFNKEQYPELVKTSLDSQSVLMVFMSLVSEYDLICYLSPTCMVLENIDDLLTNEAIGRRIDNDTCVLLTNSSSMPEIIILRPSIDVEMCIREFFTVYDNWSDRSSKLTKMRDYDVLTTLFGDSWGRIDSAEYCGLLSEESSPSEENFPHKMVDFRLRKPWMVDNKKEMGCLVDKWKYLLSQALCGKNK